LVLKPSFQQPWRGCEHILEPMWPRRFWRHPQDEETVSGKDRPGPKCLNADKPKQESQQKKKQQSIVDEFWMIGAVWPSVSSWMCRGWLLVQL
jgi:hypothetical protein